MDFKRAPWRDISLFVVELFVICNIIFLDVWILQHIQNIPKPKGVSTTKTQIIESPVAKDTVSSQSSQINPQLTQTPTIIQVFQKPSPQPSVKEYFVPLGTGQGSFGDWQSLPGTIATIDNNSYPNIRSITFEASVHNLGSDQIIYLRLFDVTDNHAIYNSDISFSGTGEQFQTSGQFALDGGVKQYQVQLKTQLHAPVSLDMARVHILLN